MVWLEVGGNEGYRADAMSSIHAHQRVGGGRETVLEHTTYIGLGI